MQSPAKENESGRTKKSKLCVNILFSSPFYVSFYLNLVSVVEREVRKTETLENVGSATVSLWSIGPKYLSRGLKTSLSV